MGAVPCRWQGKASVSTVTRPRAWSLRTGGIEPPTSPWQGDILPLNYIRRCLEVRRKFNPVRVLSTIRVVGVAPHHPYPRIASHGASTVRVLCVTVRHIEGYENASAGVTVTTRQQRRWARSRSGDVECRGRFSITWLQLTASTIMRHGCPGLRHT